MQRGEVDESCVFRVIKLWKIVKSETGNQEYCVLLRSINCYHLSEGHYLVTYIKSLV